MAHDTGQKASMDYFDQSWQIDEEFYVLGLCFLVIFFGVYDNLDDEDYDDDEEETDK